MASFIVDIGIKITLEKLELLDALLSLALWV